MIYLDYNATSPLLPEAREAMAPWWGVPGNPASVHRAGQRAAVAVEEAREAVAALVGGRPEGVVFTSGATEANHAGVRGAARLRGGRVVASAVEHPCVLGAVGELERLGTPTGVVPVDAEGRVRAEAIPEDTAVLAVMVANHETGVIQPLGAVEARARALDAWWHADATQAAGRIPLALPADSVALSAHKLGGPPGVGALVLRDGEPFPALLTGGSQERGRRAGTVNVPGVVGFAAACWAATRDLRARTETWEALSERLRVRLAGLGARRVGAPEHLLPNTTCVVFPGIDGETLVQALDQRGICVSSGAACASGSLEPSPVLTAMGDPEPGGALRISLGPDSTSGDVDQLLAALPPVLAALRAVGPL